MATTSKIVIQDGNEIIELKGADKEAFIADQNLRVQEALLLETEYAAKQAARTSALTKLATIAGLTQEEIEGLIR